MTGSIASWRVKSVVCLLLAIVVLVVFGQTVRHPFSNYDDPKYVTTNKHIQTGFTSENVIWALTSAYASNWHPVTWLSHALDFRFFGMNPAGHHAVNVLFHLLNTMLLFLLLLRMTGAPWRSAVVAALFAVHPAHVESVAWISERKDVLSAFLGLLTLWAYIRYAERPRVLRYVPVFVFFALGLMAKPMLVTLPIAFLLFDYWPLRRAQSDSPAPTSWPKLVLEKIPLLALAAASSTMTFIAQRQGGAMASLDIIPMADRVNNALVSYVRYLGEAIAPIRLSVYYPRPLHSWGLVQVTLAVALLAIITLGCLVAIRKRPYLAVGWFWFLGTLAPVIGIVQVGNQAMADRYTYLPYIGLFIMAAWGATDICGRLKKPAPILGAVSSALIVALGLAAFLQTRLWRQDIVLFRHALAVTTDNAVAHNNLGYALANAGNLQGAFDQFGEAIRIDPNHVGAYYNRGVALMMLGRLPEAAQQFQIAVSLQPTNYLAWYNLGSSLTYAHRMDEAEAAFRGAAKADPEQIEVHQILAKMLVDQGRMREAAIEYSEIIRMKPEDAGAYYMLGVSLNASGERARAIAALSEAKRLQPDYSEAAELLKRIQAGDRPEAIKALPGS